MFYGVLLVLFVLGPYTEETIRCLHADSRAKIGFKPAE